MVSAPPPRAAKLAARTCAVPALSCGSLETYLDSVARIPVLDADEEARLALRFRGHGDTAAARTLVLSSLRFVVHVARGYLDYGLPLADLLQQGNLGLMKAVQRFDPAQGVRLISFAVHWIKAEIQEFVVRNWRIVKMATTKAQRKLFFGLRKRKPRLGWLEPGEIAAIAADLQVAPQEVRAMEARFAAGDLSFDTPADDDGAAPQAGLADPQDEIAGIEEEQWAGRRRRSLAAALQQLDPRARDIVARRWLDPERSAGLEELGLLHGVSAERVRQIQNQALQQLRSALQAFDPARTAAA
jgi:RNA polymerase sigma-32 factor